MLMVNKGNDGSPEQSRNEKTFVMASEPLPDMSPEDLREWYSHNQSEQGLAVAYAAAHNKAWWVEDNEYDFEEGSPEHAEACAITDAWFTLMEEFESRIFSILRSEGVVIPEKGRIVVLCPFMERNGFFDGQGWWIRKKG